VNNATVSLDGAAVDPRAVGGKGFALNQLIAMGVTVPPTGSITTDGYRWFVRDSGLKRFIDDLSIQGLPDRADLDRAAERVDAAFLEATMPYPRKSEGSQQPSDMVHSSPCDPLPPPKTWLTRRSQASTARTSKLVTTMRCCVP